MSGAADPVAPERAAYFTLSMLFDSRQINDLLHDCWPLGLPLRWDAELLQRIQQDHGQRSKGDESETLHEAISPMFDDIADRARNLFLRDFLLDTPNPAVQLGPDGKPAGERSAALRNVCARLSLQLDHTVQWQTEGRNTESIRLGTPLRFDNVLCRAFWMAHSNEALSYHLSLEVPYRPELAQYFGLSMLQKVFFNSEGTDWLLEQGGTQGWMATRDGKTTAALLAVLEELFEGHVQHLLDVIGRAGRSEDTRGPERVKLRAWQHLVLRRRDASAQASGTDPAAWAAAGRHRRLLVVLRDATFFDTLEAARSDGSMLLTHEPIEPSASLGPLHDCYDPDELMREIRRRVDRRAGAASPEPTSQQIEAQVERYAVALFLSGFLQNIVDLLQQDRLEVHDALMPEYPPAGESGANQGFMIYATPSVVYEVVSSSRSLEGAGRQWIGTCPYIFLVHMTAFHNESLVLAYENNVSKLVGHLQAAGLNSDRSAAGKRFDAVLDHAYECIRDFRLATFEQVHKHYSFNVFRYDTERQFFNAIEEVRGVVPRREYWDKVLQHLTETVDGLKQDREGHFERSVAGFGLLLTAIGLVQTWLAIFPLDKQGGLPAWAHGVALLALVVVVGLVYRRFVPRRRGGLTAQAWRSHGDEPSA